MKVCKYNNGTVVQMKTCLFMKQREIKCVFCARLKQQIINKGDTVRRVNTDNQIP